MAVASHRPISALVVCTALSGACGERIDWSAPENMIVREESAKTDAGVELKYLSLVNATCQGVYDALADVDHYADFIPGVDRIQTVAVGENTKTVQIAQHVIGRQSNAKVQWTFLPAKREVAFTTLDSDLSYNDGRYVLSPSPDGTRCLVRSTFLVKEGRGRAQSVPIGVLAAGTRDAFVAAAEGVRKRSTRGPG